jgi:hypothetical protein
LALANKIIIAIESIAGDFSQRQRNKKEKNNK